MTWAVITDPDTVAQARKAARMLAVCTDPHGRRCRRPAFVAGPAGPQCGRCWMGDDT